MGNECVTKHDCGEYPFARGERIEAISHESVMLFDNRLM